MVRVRDYPRERGRKQEAMGWREPPISIDTTWKEKGSVFFFSGWQCIFSTSSAKALTRTRHQSILRFQANNIAPMNTFVKTFLFFAVIAQVRFTASAQTYRHSIGLSMGTFRLHSLNKQTSPLRYAGLDRPLYGLSYRHHSENSRVNLRQSGGAGTMNPDRFGARNYSTKFGDGSPYIYQISSELYHMKVLPFLLCF